MFEIVISVKRNMNPDRHPFKMAELLVSKNIE